MNDPELISLRDDLARQRAVVEELWGQVGDGGSAASIAEVQAAWLAHQCATTESPRLAAHDRLDRAISGLGGMADALNKIEELGRAMDRRARLVKTATESNLDEIMAKQFALEVGYVQRALATACEKHFDTPKARQAFMVDVQRALERLMCRE